MTKPKANSCSIYSSVCRGPTK